MLHVSSPQNSETVLDCGHWKGEGMLTDGPYFLLAQAI